MHFSINEWEIIEEEFAQGENYSKETIFALGNGYFGTRGTLEEGLPENALGAEGTFINGIFESGEIKYGEKAFGFPEKNQTMVNGPNCKGIKLFVRDEVFRLDRGSITDYTRRLDMRKGTLAREFLWESPKGDLVRIRMDRLVSFERKHVGAIYYEVTPMNFNGEIRIVSSIDSRRNGVSAENDPRVAAHNDHLNLRTSHFGHIEEGSILVQSTRNTQQMVACGFTGKLSTKSDWRTDTYSEYDDLGIVYRVKGKNKTPIRYEKYFVYIGEREMDENVDERILRELSEVKAVGYGALKEEQVAFLKAFWEASDVEIHGNPSMQQAVRFNIFHLLQSVGRDGETNISAKGLTGEGYEGHYFWDTEMYIIPSFLYSHPDICRKLLEYRYHGLPKARENAKLLAHKKGALFPWRTIGGEECSAYFLAGSAQYHINGDIAHAVEKYYQATEDMDFMLEYGAELIFETARVWMEIGFFSEEKGGAFCINGVTGPDEYTALVNNNAFTNLIAAGNLRFGREIAKKFKCEYPKDFERIKESIQLEEYEIESWGEAEEKMYIPYNEKHGITLQDDEFLSRKVWDFQNVPKENYPLLLHYHPLVIYRHQVCKQADVVLASFLLNEEFTQDQKKRDFDFYETRTTHDSSLSSCIFSIVASEIGYREKAYAYFLKTARTDLEDIHGNTRHGVHTANMAGSWMAIVNGFGGLRIRNGMLHFSPYLPEGWTGYTFKIRYQGSFVKVRVESDQIHYELLEGKEIKIVHKDQLLLVKKAESHS